MVEAYAEEAITLDPDSRWRQECVNLAKHARGWMVQFSDGLDKFVISQSIRTVRKNLVANVHDPRIKLN